MTEQVKILTWEDGVQVVRDMTPDEILDLYKPVEVVRDTMTLTFAQLLIGLVAEGWITTAEGRAWRDRISLPAPVQALIASLPEQQRFAAETKAFAPSEVLRMDPLVVGMGHATGKTPDDLDTFFRTYSTI